MILEWMEPKFMKMFLSDVSVKRALAALEDTPLQCAVLNHLNDIRAEKHRANFPAMIPY